MTGERKFLKRLATSTYKNYDTLHGSITYATTDDEVYIMSYSGNDTELTLPPLIDGKKVTCIAKKAFLSNKKIREIMLPDTILEIGDFAFARCDRLRKIGIPYTNISLGQGVLLECSALEQIYNTGNDTECTEKLKTDVSYLLAATTGMLDAFYLFDLENAGSVDWFHKWDARMKMKMEMDDSEGFSKMLLCGEEDYGSNETDPEFYKHLKRAAKVRVSMLRLMHDSMLDSEMKDMLRSYLLLHIKGCKHDETWKVILEEHGDDKEYYEFLTELPGVNENNFQDMLKDMGDRHTEMKAYLMQYIDKMNADKDAFSEFEL